MKPDGSDVKQLTSFKSVCTYPSVSPDGKKIAFRKVVDSPGYNWDLSTSKRNSEIFVMDIDGSHVINLSNNAAFDGWPCFSPDSRKIVFSSNRSGPANVGQLFVVNVDGSEQTKMTDIASSLAQPYWSATRNSIFAYQCWENAEYEYGNLIELSLEVKN